MPKVEQAEFCSRLAVAQFQHDGKAETAVMLGGPAASEGLCGLLDGKYLGLLDRELARQALLIAARDELGSITRDNVLGESTSELGGLEAIEFASLFRKTGPRQIVVRRVRAAVPQVLLERALSETSLIEDVETFERLARDEFTAVLRGLGIEGTPNRRRDDLPLPKGVEERLARVNYLDVLMAVRSLHSAIRLEGESPARIAALARGYALLGVLTEFHWHAAHKAFKARSLLYAERLVAQAPNNRDCRWTRAYVRALVGLHGDALSDLAAASRGDADASSPEPDWVPVIDAYVHFDTGRLAAVSGPSSDLAALLHLLAIETRGQSTAALRVSNEILRRDPMCFRAIDPMCEGRGLNILHVATTIGPQALELSVPEALRKMDVLPDAVRETITRKDGGPALVSALKRSDKPADDLAEPSWGCFGQMLAETAFVQVWRRLVFMDKVWGVPVDEYWVKTQELVAQHRFRPYLEAMVRPDWEAPMILGDFSDRLDMSDLEVHEWPLIKRIAASPQRRGDEAMAFASANADRVARDATLTAANRRATAENAQVLLSISPFSPYGRAALVEADWEQARPHLADWAKDDGSANSPILLAALARHYLGANQFDDAHATLVRYIRQCPDFWAYHSLARIELRRGSRTRWKETLDEYLKNGEDTGLDHARVRIEIANFLMSQNQWKDALPYSEEAAKTGAGWAMHSAGACNEGLAQYDRAEHWFRSESERYRESFMHWLLFCQRTGHGDLAAASRQVESFFKSQADHLSEEEKLLMIVYCELADRPADGIAFIERLRQMPAIMAGRQGGRFERWIEEMFLARFADTLNDAVRRADGWRRGSEQQDAPIAAKLCALFRDALQPGAKQPLDPDAINTVILTAVPVDQAILDFFAGCVFDRHGQAAEAARFWRRSARSEQVSPLFSIMAARALRDQSKRSNPGAQPTRASLPRGTGRVAGSGDSVDSEKRPRQLAAPTLS